MTTIAERSYLAGIIDGEGSISMTRVTGQRAGAWWRVAISVSSCDRELIDWLHERWQGSALYDMDRGLNKRLQHRWTVVGNAARQVLKEASPYFIIKSMRAGWAVEVLEIQRQERRGYRPYTEAEQARLLEIRQLFDTDRGRSLSTRKRVFRG